MGSVAFGGLSDVWGTCVPQAFGDLCPTKKAQAWYGRAKLPSFYIASAYALFTPPTIRNCRVSPYRQCELRNVHIAVSHLSPSELN